VACERVTPHLLPLLPADDGGILYFDESLRLRLKESVQDTIRAIGAIEHHPES
jgi:hypothetical protein